MTARSRPASLAHAATPGASLVSAPGGLQASGAATLEGLYQRWEALRLERDEAAREHARAQRRLEEQGAFLLGTVRAAGEQDPEGIPDPTGAALQPSGTLAHFVGEAEARLSRSRVELDAASGARRTDLEAQLRGAASEVVDALGRYQSLTSPRLTLLRRPVPGGRAILHLERPSPDAAVLLTRLLSGKVPTVYGFLFDEATDDPQREPPSLYAHEGIAPERTRPTPAEWRALLSGEERMHLPLRGVIPFFVPTPGGQALAQWRLRGPVLELEWETEDGFRSLLSAAEAEWAAGTLLRLQLAGLLELELAAG